MRTLLRILIGIPVGGFVGYMAGVYIACGLFDMGNLCGLLGVFITGPLGGILGGIAGWRMARPTKEGGG